MSVINLESFRFPSNNLNEDLANVAMNHINEAVMITDHENRIIYVNKKFEQTTGYTFAEVRGKTPRALQSGIQEFSFYEKMKEAVKKTGKWQGELWNRTKGGKVYLQSLSIVALKDHEGNVTNFVGILTDLFKHRESENEIHHMTTTYHDSLTNLPNRNYFEKRALSTLNRAKLLEESFAVIFFQLDNFTNIIDKRGTLFGDVLLKRIATKFMDNTAENCLITRWNNTEFVCILEQINDIEEIQNFIQVLYEKINAPMNVNGIEVQLETNFGIYLVEKSEESVSELLSKANAAMLKAKADHTIFDFFEKNLCTPSDFFVTEFELKNAIDQEHFELYYQPVMEVEKRKLIGFEALIRWNHPTAGIVPPNKFIPLAEQTGLITDISKLVFKQACEQLSEWRKKGFTDIQINVNLSMTEFKDTCLVENIENTLKEFQVPAEKIVIELTESSFNENKEETITKLHQLKTLGLHIAIDDFGTGYSSLGYIIDFPVDKLKIDRTFIKVINENKKIEAIVSAINTMAKTMDITVVAEGIETEEQLKTVRKLQCNLVQGFLFDRPMPKNEAEAKWLVK